ncbi:MAG: biotin/lipoate A/B protein ligase family protein [Gemmataceae bacterium]
MDFLELTLPGPAENLALDEALLLQAESGEAGEILRIWELPQLAVVLGAGGKLKEDVHEEACLLDGVPILRRASGGGTVLLGPGSLCYSLVLAQDSHPALQDILPSYEHILSRVAEAVGVPGLTMAGTSDLTLELVKCSGNAQQRKRRYLLHHGTLLHGMDLDRVGRYLRMPVRQPDYRAGRDHASFVRNLEVRRDKLIAGLRESWGARTLRQAWPQEQVQSLVAEKYELTSWINRR